MDIRPVLVFFLVLLAALLFFTPNSQKNSVYLDYKVERGRCGQITKQGWEYLWIEGDKILFSAWVSEYCDPDGNVNVYGFLDENGSVRVIVEWNGEITRCFCPFHIEGTLRVPGTSDLKNLKYILVSFVPDMGERVVDTKKAESLDGCPCAGGA